MSNSVKGTFIGSRVVPCGLTFIRKDKYDEANIAFHNFANALENISSFP